MIAPRPAPRRASLGGCGSRARVGAARGEGGLWHFSAPRVALRGAGNPWSAVREVGSWADAPRSAHLGALSGGRTRVGLARGGRPGEGQFCGRGLAAQVGMGTWYPPPPSLAWVRAPSWEGEPRGCVVLAASAPSLALARCLGVSPPCGPGDHLGTVEVEDLLFCREPGLVRTVCQQPSKAPSSYTWGELGCPET